MKDYSQIIPMCSVLSMLRSEHSQARIVPEWEKIYEELFFDILFILIVNDQASIF